jgi:hypothetical protein
VDGCTAPVRLLMVDGQRVESSMRTGAEREGRGEEGRVGEMKRYRVDEQSRVREMSQSEEC